MISNKEFKKLLWNTVWHRKLEVNFGYEIIMGDGSPTSDAQQDRRHDNFWAKHVSPTGASKSINLHKMSKSNACIHSNI